MKTTPTLANSNNNNHYPPISPERRETIMNRVEAILNSGHNVEIKRRSNGIIAVMEVKVKKYEV
jgi:hypothetical protein